MCWQIGPSLDWPLVGQTDERTFNSDLDNGKTVHLNRVRPLLTEDTDNYKVKADWTPPLFHYDVADVRVVHQVITYHLLMITCLPLIRIIH